MVFLAVATAGITAMTLRHGGGRWDVLLAPLGLMALVAVQVVMGLWKWRALVKAGRRSSP